MARQGWARDKKSGPLLPGSILSKNPGLRCTTETAAPLYLCSQVHGCQGRCRPGPASGFPLDLTDDGWKVLQLLQVLLSKDHPNPDSDTAGPEPFASPRLPLPRPPGIMDLCETCCRAIRHCNFESPSAAPCPDSAVKPARTTSAHCPGRIHDGAAPIPRGLL